MKRIYSLLLIMGFFLTVMSCQDEIDIDSAIDFPPSIVESTPSGPTKIGGFDINVKLAGASKASLKSGSVVLKDANGTVIYSSGTQELIGVRDSIFVEGTEFNAADLPVGEYSLDVVATNTRDRQLSTTINFSITESLFPALNTEMYLAGSFNSWGADAMELVADYTWEIKEVDLKGGEWKLKNTVNWSDMDWGDPDCDGVMAEKGANTNCGFDGLVNIRFNEKSLIYTVEPSVKFPTNLKGLFLVGPTITESRKFNLIGDYTWELPEVRLKEGDIFRFAESANFQGANYGGTGMSGKAVLYGNPFNFAGADAFYKITFNDKSRAFEITKVRDVFELYLVGGGTSVGWNAGNALPFKTIGEKHYEIYHYITAGQGFKFLIVPDWPGDWGADPSNPGKVIQEGEANVDVPQSGFYRIRVNLADQTYEAVKTEWAVVGSATPGAWDNDTDMTFISGTTWQVDMELSGSGEFKFRANDGWAINLGQDVGPTLKYDGGNYPTPGAGTYRITLNLDAIEGYSYTISAL